MTDIIIPDISYWQGLPYSESPNDSGIDYDKLAAMSPHGLIMRASYGMQEDLRFQQNYDELAYRVSLGAYHYLLDDVNGAWQAEAFLSVIAGMYFDHPLIVDVEDNSAGLSKSALAARILVEGTMEGLFTGSALTSHVNDDKTDNVFEMKIGRFSQIEEDEPPVHLLVSDY